MSTAGPYYPNGSNFPPPPGQGQHPAAPAANSAPGVGGPPPPRATPSPRDPRASVDSNIQYRASPGRRSFASSEHNPHDGNVLTPYDNEKAYAEYTDAYGPPPSSSSAGGGARGPLPAEHHPGYPDDPRDRYYQDKENSYDDPRYDDRRYDDRRYDSRPPPSTIRDERSRYDSRDRYDPSPPRSRGPAKKDKDFFRQGGNGERGLASAVLGAAAGAWIGHEAGRGPLGTLSGMAVGAIGGSAIEKQVDLHREKKRREHEDRRFQREGGGGYDDGSRYPSRSSFGDESASPRRRRDSRAASRGASRDSGPRRRYSGSEDSYLNERR